MRHTIYKYIRNQKQQYDKRQNCRKHNQQHKYKGARMFQVRFHFFSHCYSITHVLTSSLTEQH